MNLDICSICYNEEVLLPLFLERWLAVPWVKNIYLVDGGSTDQTVEIAKSQGDRVSVISVPWKNDFAKQRNIAIKFGKSEYLIQPDIDEIPIGNLKENIFAGSDAATNQIALPYLKFYDLKTLWFFNDGNTPSNEGTKITFGTKSTLTVFRRDYLLGYSKSLHEMPRFRGEERRLDLRMTATIDELKDLFVVGHFDQAKHFLQAEKNKTSLFLEMGLKRVRYRLISPATYDGKVYDQSWARRALDRFNAGDASMIEDLGQRQFEAFMDQHTILDRYDASQLVSQD